MRLRTIVAAVVALGLLTGTMGIASLAGEGGKKQAKLEAKAKITRAEAEQIALTKAPGATVKTAELEKEKGKLVWSFDIATPDSKNLTEVLVDAKTGKIVSVETETSAAEAEDAKEKATEKNGKGKKRSKQGEHEQDDDDKNEKK